MHTADGGTVRPDGLFLQVLGPLTVRRDGVELSIGGPLPRALLSALAANGGRTVPVQRLVDELWGDEPPDSAEATIASYVSRLRKVLDEPDTPVDRSTIRRHGSGYRLVVPEGGRDDVRFREALADGRRALRSGELEAAASALDEALSAWSDDLPPLEDLPPGARPEAMRLAEERTEAIEARADLLIRLGRHDEVLGTLESLVATHPLRERSGQLLATALYRAGRQPEALAALRSLVARLDDEYGLEPRPALRALEHDILVQAPSLEREVGTSPAASAPPEAPVPEPRRAPSTLTRLVGRESLLERTLEQLESHRLVTLVGPGGVGTTRLAAAVAHRVDAAWAPLADTRHEGLVEAELVAALGAAPQPGVPERQQLLAAARQGPGRLVVDNAEHVVPAVAAACAALLAESASTSILVTSRTPLGVPGEVVVDVTPLETVVADGDESPAATLFLERAIDAAPGWVPDEHDRTVADELCRRLDGLPLAVELAAARVRDLAPDEILAGLESGAELLSGGSSATPHHTSLSTAMAWSYELLDEGDRAALRALSSFDGSFELEAATAALGRPAVNAVSSLVAGSLLVADRSSRPRRYRMLQVVREWTRALVPPDEDAAIGHRLATWAAGLARSIATDLRTPTAGPALARLDADMPNVRRALEGALRHGSGDAALALEAIIDLEPYWQRHRPEEGIELLRAALDRVRATEEPDDTVVADGLLMLLRLCWASGDHPLGATAAQDAAQLALEVEHPFVEVVATAGLAVMSVGAGDLERSAAVADRAVERAEVLSGRSGAEALANALLARAVVHEAAGAADEALELLDGAARAADAADEWTLLLAVAYHHGRVAFRTGNLQLAAQVAAPAASLAIDIGVDGALVQHARTLGAALAAQGRTDQGSLLVGAADAHALRLGSSPGDADPAFAEELDAVVDPTVRDDGATWSRSRLVDALRELELDLDG